MLDHKDLAMANIFRHTVSGADLVASPSLEKPKTMADTRSNDRRSTVTTESMTTTQASDDELKDRKLGNVLSSRTQSHSSMISMQSQTSQSSGSFPLGINANSNSRRRRKYTYKCREVSSYKIFSQFVRYFGDGSCDSSGIVSPECYAKWIESRRKLPKKPQEAFRRALTAHCRGVDGRKPFPPEVEENLLSELRKKKQWRCFENLKNCGSIGVQGFPSLGYHESRKNTTAASMDTLNMFTTSGASQNGGVGANAPLSTSTNIKKKLKRTKSDSSVRLSTPQNAFPGNAFSNHAHMSQNNMNNHLNNTRGNIDININLGSGAADHIKGNNFNQNFGIPSDTTAGKGFVPLKFNNVNLPFNSLYPYANGGYNNFDSVAHSFPQPGYGMPLLGAPAFYAPNFFNLKVENHNDFEDFVNQGLEDQMNMNLHMSDFSHSINISHNGDEEHERDHDIENDNDEDMQSSPRDKRRYSALLTKTLLLTGNKNDSNSNSVKNEDMHFEPFVC